MKFTLVLFALFLISMPLFCQTRNNISIVYGIADNAGDNHGAIGDYGYNGQSAWMYGLSYTRTLTRTFSLETGLLYSVNKVELTTIGPRGGLYDQNVKLISVPLYAKLSFFKYVFAQWGVMLDHETNYNSDSVINDQSGVGLALGIGGQYHIGQANIFVNPYFCRHAFTAQNDIVETGVKFGVGYDF
jgi:hypothetical protein